MLSASIVIFCAQFFAVNSQPVFANNFPVPFSTTSSTNWCSSTLQTDLNQTDFTSQLGSNFNLLETIDCDAKVSLISQNQWEAYRDIYYQTLGTSNYLPPNTASSWTQTTATESASSQVYQILPTGSLAPANTESLADAAPLIKISTPTACVSGGGTISDPYLIVSDSLCPALITPTPTPSTTNSNSTTNATRTCDAGYYVRGDTCQLSCSVSNCISCSAPDYCQSCHGGYFLHYGTCVPNCNVANCYTCNQPNYCSKCAPGFSLIAGQCQLTSQPQPSPTIVSTATTTLPPQSTPALTPTPKVQPEIATTQDQPPSTSSSSITISLILLGVIIIIVGGGWFIKHRHQQINIIAMLLITGCLLTLTAGATKIIATTYQRVNLHPGAIIQLGDYKFVKLSNDGLYLSLESASLSSLNPDPITFTPNVDNVGVWWWYPSTSMDHLDFAAANGISEIYYAINLKIAANRDTAAEFVTLANSKGVEVYYLAGEVTWLDNYPSFTAVMDSYTTYQQENPAAAFVGVHLDVEPAQHQDWDINRTQQLEKYVQFVTRATDDYGALDFDITYWMDDIISGEPVYQTIIRLARRVFVMSYRDTAAATYNAGQEEVTFAASLNKPIFLSGETYSLEGDHVSYMEETQEYMYQELNKLKGLAGDYDQLGIAIHQIETWKALPPR